jgi:uncharacterized protein (DUF1684 family)
MNFYNITFTRWLALLFLASLLYSCQPDTYYSELEIYQQEQNAFFSDTNTSPLTKEGLAHFDRLEFFPADKKYCVTADFSLTPDASSFLMPTTTERVVEYKKYGTASFELDGKKYTLSIYQNQEIKDKEEYEDYLFLPYKDWTNGHESYGGGRYINLTIPDGNKIVIDFNKSYNPYCAYNDRYSCPIPPDENHLDTEIRAGVRAYDH